MTTTPTTPTTPTPPSTHRRKLIEVDLPLDHINAQSAREKSIRHGHPSTLHLWWARRPLASCRAVIFASMVDDPESCPDEFRNEDAVREERARLHKIIADLVIWENTDEREPAARDLLNAARYEIARSIARNPDAPAAPPQDDPAAVLRYLAHNALPIYDPFAGGGSIPLEAQRLGMKAIATDLNPVAVLINKALIELPREFAANPPVNPKADPLGMTTGKGKRAKKIAWSGAAGIADDIRYYGNWMRQQAHNRIGRLYPKAKLPDGGEATVIAWLWARTIPCPNPACGADMPLMNTFQASSKSNNLHWIKPVIHRDTQPPAISFQVQDHPVGMPDIRRSVISDGKGAVCVACGTPVAQTYIRDQGQAGNMSVVMTCIVAAGDRKRIFLSPTNAHIQTAQAAKPEWHPSETLPDRALGFNVQIYGSTHWHQLFTQRQLAALATFSDMVEEVAEQILADGGSQEYANIVRTYLALAVGKLANGGSSYGRWRNAGQFVDGVFARQAIPMIWDFGEANPFSDYSQNWMGQIEWVARVVERLPAHANVGQALQADATNTIHAETGPVIVTDPPYYDNIGYADLSDFFYVWLRPSLRDLYPELFAGILAPKDEEMIATPHRFENPRERFETLMGKTLRLVRERCSPEFPSSIFYAYKQQEETRDGATSTGWDTMLTALVNAGFQIIGTWPMRTEMSNRPRSIGSNALASSVILVCRPRPEDAPSATRRQFLTALEREMPGRLTRLTRENHIAPVDLRQAAIGPGMEIYSGYSKVESISGDPVSVREALTAIQNAIDAYDRQIVGDLDDPSKFCYLWLTQHEYAAGEYGEAEVLSQSTNIGINKLADDNLLIADRGKVRLLDYEDFAADSRRPNSGICAWDACMRIAWHMSHEDGRTVQGAADALSRMSADIDSAERLARALYNHYDKTADSRRAAMFNDIVTNWQDIMAAMRQRAEETQAQLMDGSRAR